MLDVTPLAESSINPTTLEYLNLPPKSLMSDDFEYAVKWNEEKFQYDFEGNLQIVEMNENRREVLDAMLDLKNGGTVEVHPRDVCKYFSVSVTSKDGRRLSKTMQRMLGDSELIKGNKYGTYIYMEPSSNY